MLMVFCISLGPVFFDSWIYKGTGNANFFYFLTLGFLLGQVGLMVETSRVFLKELRDHKKVKQQ
jgi:phosphatidylinositol glycan class U